MADGFTNAKASNALRVVAAEIDAGRAQVDGIVMVISTSKGIRAITIGDEMAAGCALGLVLQEAKAELAQFVALSAPAPSMAVN